MVDSSGHSVKFPFKLPYVDMGVVGPPSMGAGIAEISEWGVVLRFVYQTEDLARAFRSGGALESRLGVGEIRSVQLKEGWFTDRLIVEATSSSATDGIPGSDRGRVVLKVPRSEREAARRAQSLLGASLASGEAERTSGSGASR